jgi:hypothetical protein
MTIYCIDTSSLISAWSERYPIKNFPGFWKQFDGLIEDGRLVSPEEVRLEIIKKSEGLDVWVKQHRDMFIALDEDLQLTVRDILTEFRLLTKNLPGRNSADPFVIALAKMKNYTVVTEEGLGSVNRPRIPFVCEHYKIKCINILGLIKAENWVI